MVRRLPGDILMRAGLERRGFTTALTLDVSTICAGYRPVALLATLIPAGFSANRNRGRSCSRQPTAGPRYRLQNDLSRTTHSAVATPYVAGEWQSSCLRLKRIHEGSRFVRHFQQLGPT